MTKLIEFLFLNTKAIQVLFEFHDVLVRGIKKVTRDLKHDKVVEKFDYGFAFKIMTDCLNEASKTGSFPDCFKTGNIVSVYRANDPFNRSSYRPVCLFLFCLKYLKARFFYQSSNCAIGFA